MWTIRFILLAILAVLDGLCILLLRYRSRFHRLAESTLFNGLLLPVYYSLLLLVFLLPPDAGWDARPAWLEYESVRMGFPVVGLLLVLGGSFLGLATLRQRKVIGAQDVADGLLTTGMYAHFRHPIWTGVLWMLLGLALLARNPDALLVYPVYFLLAWGGTIFEEKSDMRRRFPEDYARYSASTPMFGPLWMWGIWALILGLIVGGGR